MKNLNKDETYQPERLKILLVEDDDVDAMSFCRAMKKNQFDTPVIRAHDGKEALDILSSWHAQQPFIVILDLQMPRINGMELIQQIRSQQEFSNTVIFVLTSSSDKNDINNAYDQHVAGYFVKNKNSRKVEDMLKTLSSYWSNIELPAGRVH